LSSKSGSATTSLSRSSSGSSGSGIEQLEGRGGKKQQERGALKQALDRRQIGTKVSTGVPGLVVHKVKLAG